MDTISEADLTRNTKTFRPKKNTPVGEKGLELKKHKDATLGRGAVYEAVVLPPGEDPREWLAVNTVDLYNALAVLFVAAEEFCTDERCKTMSAGPKYEYLWADGVKVKKPIKLSAPRYINTLFDWVEEQLDDRALFPNEPGATFPPDYLDAVKCIFKRLFRVYAHLFHSHWHDLEALGASAHVNSAFKHFILFAKHFGLIDTKELAPLQELIDTLTAPPASRR